jgi:hypothetical protein
MVGWLFYRDSKIQANTPAYLQRLFYSICLKWKLTINCDKSPKNEPPKYRIAVILIFLLWNNLLTTVNNTTRTPPDRKGLYLIYILHRLFHHNPVISFSIFLLSAVKGAFHTDPPSLLVLRNQISQATRVGRAFSNKFIFKEKTYSVQNFWNGPRITICVSKTV